ncbi:hypothetical protein JCM11672_15880 [Alkaliphilus crotonatoxidans]
MMLSRECSISYMKYERIYLTRYRPLFEELIVEIYSEKIKLSNTLFLKEKDDLFKQIIMDLNYFSEL